MRTVKAVLSAAVAAAVLGISGCGNDGEGVTVYKQGHYQGKADTQPYSSPAFAGDKSKWEGAIRARGQLQNEYNRVRG